MRRGKHTTGPDGACTDECFACRVKTVTVAQSAMVTRCPSAVRTKATDKALDKDRGAYKRLRKNGEQPRRIKGAAALEATADHRFEIQTGVVQRDPKVRRHAKAVFSDLPPPTTKPGVVGR